MSKRNVAKIIADIESKICLKYDMTIEEAKKIRSISANDQYYLIVNSFKFGYAMGRKAAKKELANKAAKSK